MGSIDGISETGPSDQHGVDVLIGDVEASVGIVGIRVAGPELRHCSNDVVLQSGQTEGDLGFHPAQARRSERPLEWAAF